MTRARELGLSGEAAAVRFLEKQRFKIVRRGFRFHRGEIDIIAWDRGTLVFIEVKTRENLDCGRPEEAVSPAKQRQIRRLAEAYLGLNRLENAVCRFDVLALLREADGGFAVEHFRDAF